MTAPSRATLGRVLVRAGIVVLVALIYLPVRRAAAVRSAPFPYEAVYEKFCARDSSHVHLYAPRDRPAAR